jgi:hypothetical protein
VSEIYYHCDGCQLSIDRGYKARVYVMPDGREAQMPQRHVWCVRCATITPAESIEQSEDDHPIAGLAAWRALRKRPARCLRCGNQDIALPADHLADLPHPCGGTLRCTFSLWGGTGPRYRPHRYSVEGELLEQGVQRSGFAGDPDEPYDLW